MTSLICPHCAVALPPSFIQLKPQRVPLRYYLIPALFELCRASKGLTLDEIAALSDDPTRIRRHFAQLKHFNLIRKDAGRYFPMELAKNFVNGQARLPDAVWTLNGRIVDAPEADSNVNYLFAWEIGGTNIVQPPQKYAAYQPMLLPI